MSMQWTDLGQYWMTGDAKQRGLAHFTPTSGWTITYHSTSDQWFIQCQGQSLPLLITHPFILSFKPNSRAPTACQGPSWALGSVGWAKDTKPQALSLMMRQIVPGLPPSTSTHGMSVTSWAEPWRFLSERIWSSECPLQYHTLHTIRLSLNGCHQWMDWLFLCLPAPWEKLHKEGILSILTSEHRRA